MVFNLLFLIIACVASAIAGATFSAVVLKFRDRQVGGLKKQVKSVKERF